MLSKPSQHHQPVDLRGGPVDGCKCYIGPTSIWHDGTIRARVEWQNPNYWLLYIGELRLSDMCGERTRPVLDFVDYMPVDLKAGA